MQESGRLRVVLVVAVFVAVAAVAVIGPGASRKRQRAYRLRHYYRGASLVVYRRDTRDRALETDGDGQMILTERGHAGGKVTSDERRRMAPEKAASVIDRGFIERHRQRGVVSSDREPPRSAGPTVGLKVFVPEIQMLSFAWYSSSAVPASVRGLLSEADHLWDEGVIGREGAATPLGHADAISRIEFVRADVSIKEWAQAPTGPPYDELVSQSGDGSQTLWLKGPEGRRVRAATSGPGGRHFLATAWDQTGTRLAVMSKAGPKGADLSTVEPPGLVLRHVASLDMDTGPEAEPMFPVWAGGRVVIFGSRLPTNPFVALEVNVVTGAARVLCSDAGRPGEEWPPVDDAVASPDGRYVAFYRRARSPYRRYGLWLLDLDTGKCDKVTWEDGDSYFHVALRWETSDRILFARDNHEEHRWDLYRAYIESVPSDPIRRPRR